MKMALESATRGQKLVLFAVAVAILLVGVLGASEAEAKRKKVNVVRCADVGFECVGTKGKDRLVGTPGSESIFGRGGNDVYEANGGNTSLSDFNLNSNDSYTNVDPGAGRNTIVIDAGGSADFLDMGTFATSDVTFIRFNNGVNYDDELTIRGPEFRDFDVANHFGAGRIEKIEFANGTITGGQVASLTGEATPEERSTPEDLLDDEPMRQAQP